jgi:hypothetical protein
MRDSFLPGLDVLSLSDLRRGRFPPVQAERGAVMPAYIRKSRRWQYLWIGFLLGCITSALVVQIVIVPPPRKTEMDVFMTGLQRVMMKPGSYLPPVIAGRA